MGLDINLIRADKGGDPNIVRESEKRRFRDPAKVEECIALDKQWREKTFTADNLRKEFNKLNTAIGEKKKASKGADPCTDEIAKSKALQDDIKKAEEEADVIAEQLEKKFGTVGNLVHESVPVSNDEKDNRIERTWGTISELKVDSTYGKCHHHEILAMIDGYEPKRGQKIVGHRGYFLKGAGALLNLALVNYGMSFLFKKGYTPIQPPNFIKKSVMAETAQLADFDDQLYKVSGNKNDEDCYLIATSEQPISALHRGEWLETKEVPIRYCGFSPCYRKESGAHGKDTWGIFRVHQFEKIEQFLITAPEESWKAHEDMIQVSEEFYQSLELPYRVVNICSGELNDAAAKKYDLEAWFPGYNAYRELVSCSNCTDYQARSLEIRYGGKKAGDKEKKYVHMLNGTLCATERTLCCILENYQTDKGVKVPKVLIPYMHGLEFIPYTKPIPKASDLTEEAGEGKEKDAGKKKGGEKPQTAAKEETKAQ